MCSCDHEMGLKQQGNKQRCNLKGLRTCHNEVVAIGNFDDRFTGVKFEQATHLGADIVLLDVISDGGAKLSGVRVK